MANIINQRFGQREITDVVFKAKAAMKIGPYEFVKGQPVLLIDSATASTVEQSATTVYARGGRGNTKLISWEGEKELTFSVTDALLSPISLAMLTGADLFTEKDGTASQVHVRKTATAIVAEDGEIDLTDALLTNDAIDSTAPVFVMETAEDGSIIPNVITATASGKKITVAEANAGKTVYCDFYVKRAAASVNELQINANNFAGYFYVEASTLFRAQADGVDRPVEMTLPNVKIQSNFSFAMSPTGDPTTFEFKMDAMPGYTFFNPLKKTLMVMQVVDENLAANDEVTSLMGE